MVPLLTITPYRTFVYYAAGQGLEACSFCTGCRYFYKLAGNLLKQSPGLFQPLRRH